MSETQRLTLMAVEKLTSLEMEMLMSFDVLRAALVFQRCAHMSFLGLETVLCLILLNIVKKDTEICLTAHL